MPCVAARVVVCAIVSIVTMVPITLEATRVSLAWDNGLQLLWWGSIDMADMVRYVQQIATIADWASLWVVFLDCGVHGYGRNYEQKTIRLTFLLVSILDSRKKTASRSGEVAYCDCGLVHSTSFVGKEYVH